MRTFLLMLLMCSTCTAHEFMRTAPNGNRYDSRMWRYSSKLQKVVVKTEYEGMSEIQRFRAAGIDHHFDDPKWIAHNERLKLKAQAARQLISQRARERSQRYSQRPIQVYNFYYYYRSPYYPVYGYGRMWSY